MKKATILALATIAIFAASCGNGATSTTTTDSTAVDSTAVSATDSTTAEISADGETVK